MNPKALYTSLFIVNLADYKPYYILVGWYYSILEIVNEK